MAGSGCGQLAGSLGGHMSSGASHIMVAKFKRRYPRDQHSEREEEEVASPQRKGLQLMSTAFYWLSCRGPAQNQREGK